MKLENLGWRSFFADHFDIYHQRLLRPGRVSLEHKNSYTIWTELGEIPGEPSGKLFFDALSRVDLPVVGDWTAVQVLDEQEPHAVIHAVLPRFGTISRKMAGTQVDEQPLAANIDTIFIVIGLDHNFSLRRIERYLALAWESGSQPVVLLSKADTCPDAEDRVSEAEMSAPGVPVHAVSSFQDAGLETLSTYLSPGTTAALLGSSGVGKSTLLNRLAGRDIQRVQDVRAVDSKGRHTTTHRQMFILPGGALVIDTPGMRELQLWNADVGLSDAFADIVAMGGRCRFADCSHQQELGCAVRQAIEDGELDPDRLENYLKMHRELDYLERKTDRGAASAERAKWKKIAKAINRMQRERGE